MIGFENKKGSILIVNVKKEPDLALDRFLREEGYFVGSVYNYTDAMDMLTHKAIDIILVEIGIPNKSCMALLKEVKQIKPKIQIIMMTDRGSVNSYLEAMILGAYEYFNKPIKNKILSKVIEKALVVSN